MWAGVGVVGRVHVVERVDKKHVLTYFSLLRSQKGWRLKRTRRFIENFFAKEEDEEEKDEEVKQDE